MTTSSPRASTHDMTATQCLTPVHDTCGGPTKLKIHQEWKIGPNHRYQGGQQCELERTGRCFKRAHSLHTRHSYVCMYILYRTMAVQFTMTLISEDLCWTILQMTPFIPIDDVVAFTGVSRVTIFRILALYRATGDVVKYHNHQKLGWRRLLTPNDVAVGFFSYHWHYCWHLDTPVSARTNWQVMRHISRWAQRRAWGEMWCISVSCYRLASTKTKRPYYEKGIPPQILINNPPTNHFFSQLTRQAMERNADKRAAYLYNIGLFYQPDQLVFVDESSCDHRTTYRNKAWAIRGQRAIRKAFFVRGQRYALHTFLVNWCSFTHVDTRSFRLSRSMVFSALI